MNADGSGKVQLTKDSARSALPDWSPDGTQIVFSYMVSETSRRRRRPHRHICHERRRQRSSERDVKGTRDASADYWPMWATDGKIYFCRFYRRQKPAAEFSVNPDWSGLTQMMELPSEKGEPIYLRLH